MTNTERDALYEQIIEHAELELSLTAQGESSESSEERESPGRGAELEANPLNETLPLIWERVKTMLWGHFGLDDELLRPLAESKTPLHDLNDLVIAKMTYEANFSTSGKREDRLGGEDAMQRMK